jgi:hypothetical protein
MGILDDAIREHLELKRQHGAGDSELQQLENEAFGAAERPGGDGAPSDALAEAPTEFMAQADASAGETSADGSAEAPEPPSPRSGAAVQIADLQEAPEPRPPAEKEQPAAEHELVEEPEPPVEEPPVDEPVPGPSTEERHVIAEQPTELFDVEEEFAGSEQVVPSEEDLVEEEIGEPRLTPVDPLAGLEEIEEVEAGEGPEVVEAPGDDDEEDDFFSEQRLSDELDQALEAPLADEEDAEEEEDLGERAAEPAFEEDDAEEEPPAPPARDEDVLEETPDFLEETPEDDELWFEQKPPKDFDFDD